MKIIKNIKDLRNEIDVNIAVIEEQEFNDAKMILAFKSQQVELEVVKTDLEERIAILQADLIVANQSLGLVGDELFFLES